MNNRETMRRRGPALTVLLLTLLAWLLPQRAAATYVDETYNYQVMLSGSNTIRIQVPCYDQDGYDAWVRDGRLYVTVDGVKQLAFQWRRDGITDSDSKDIYIHFKTEVGGSFDVTQGNSANHFTLTKGDGELTRLVYRNNDGDTYNVTAVWRLPYAWLGKTLKFSWDVVRTGHLRHTENVSGLNDVTVTVPEAQGVVTPQVTMATLAFSEQGKLELPWFLAANELTAARYEYTDGSGKTVSQQLPTDATSGTIYLDATVPHDNFRIIVTYKDNDGYEIEEVSSEAQDLTMVHAPVGLSATPLGDSKASVQLRWNTLYPAVDDMASTDFFEIQRSLTGRDEDFVTIGSEPYIADGTTSYTYTDSTLVSAITEAQLKGGGTLDSLTYRVRRMLTQNWGWTGNTCAAAASCVVSDMHLLRISNYSARWEDERAQTVRVTWDYANEPNAVWDTRANLLLRVEMKNRAGEVVDTMLYTLNADERQQRYKVIDLSRPCVSYDIKVYVSRGTSPLKNFDELTPYYFPIRTEADWQTFRSKVEEAKGAYDVNARLYADISTSQRIGTTEATAYRGHFDGNGHTLTFTANTNPNIEFIAPFCYAKDYTITNLTVRGSISGYHSAAGLVASSLASEGSRNTISNCRISATIKTYSTHAGGIIGHGHSSNHDITNCLFDGKITSYNGQYAGAIIGWEDPGNDNYIANCVENGTFEGFPHTNMVWTYTGDGNGTGTAPELNASNQHTSEFLPLPETTIIDGKTFYILRTTADWAQFTQKVKDANGNADVNAIMQADFNMGNTTVGMDAYPYRGIFNGNGHTLTVKVEWNSDLYAAPFPSVKDATFLNLHVTGTVNGGQHSGGLVGHIYGDYGLTIKNVIVSATITTTDRYVGGFVGHTNDGNSVTTITDCLFDGVLKTTQTSGDRYGGAFLGWGYGTWHFEHNYENGSYTNINHAGMCYRHTDAWGGSATNYSAHDWGEITASNRKMTDQSTAVQKLGSEWQLVNGKAQPVLTTVEDERYEAPTTDQLLSALGDGWKQEGDQVVPVTTTFADPAATYPEPTLPTFYHESTGKIDKVLHTETRQSSVVLTWTTDDNPIDYFTVLRRVKGQQDWTIVETDITQMGYEDKTVSPLQDYEYKVRATNDCEGQSYTETDVADGACKHTGRVSGYVRMKDGTGVPGLSLEIKSGNTIVNATTDESGYFVADGLSYLGQPSVTYIVTPISSGALSLEVASYAVEFNNETNDRTLKDFIVTSSCRFSGYVMYEGTSIPVKGVHFRLDGKEVHNNKGGLVETDFDGSFSFRVLPGPHKIQSVMDGHTFADKGYFKGEGGYDFQDDVAQIYFYDTKKVKVTGRVVGGNDQGSLPLDNNLSHNNLGDNLTMVLTLEGDNTSWLVYDNLNPTQQQRVDTYEHPAGGGHKTVATVQRKRMEVKPAPATGEYMLELPPVRWKVSQVYCDGYATLFQEGQVSEVIDLTDCLTPDTIRHEGTFTDVDGRSVYQPTEIYNYRYDRIYHAPVEITYRQAGYDSFDYFGDKSYFAANLGGDKAEVPLAYVTSDGEVAYTFGYPVFSLERGYPIEITVAEHYPYNNAASSQQEDLVAVGGGTVTIHNGFKNGLTQETVKLDEQGQGRYVLRAEQITRLLTGEDALRTMTMTLSQDGTTYEATPLRGYLLNMFSTTGSKDVLCADQPVLIDILRDPPGGSSSATLSKNSKLKYSYTVDMSFKAGLDISFGYGTTLDTYSGLVAGTKEYGFLLSGKSYSLLDLDIIFSGSGKKAFSYTMTLSEDITTSTAASMVGADADLYIGVVQNMVVSPASTIRAIPDSTYQQMLGRLGGQTLPTGNKVKYGTLVHIAEGHDLSGNTFHLVRDESLSYGPQVTSQFVHAQRYIVTELLPKLANEIFAMIFTGSRDEAQAQANATGKPVYLSTVAADDEDFGIEYEMILPAGMTTYRDEVVEKYAIFQKWLDIICTNEGEKLAAYDLLANYDVDGGSKVTHSETFENEFSQSQNINYPFATNDYFGESGSPSAEDRALNAANILLSQPVLASLLKDLGKLASKQFSNQKPSGTTDGKDVGNQKLTEIDFSGRLFKFGITPVAQYETKPSYGTTNSYSRKESFTIAMDPKSHLDVDVYRVVTQPITTSDTDQFDIFRNNNFDDWMNSSVAHLADGVNLTDAIYPRSFVYRTRGGATCNPWEDKRETMLYQPGTTLDERTKKIQNPIITLDKQSVSGVAVGDPARFKMYITNDSEYPEAATGSLAMFNLYVDMTSNPNGAKLQVDGVPLNGNGMAISLNPGQVVEKTLEVYAGSEFDYEGLALVIASSSDFAHTQNVVKFDVHYLRQAGPVLITQPGDKWVMNTDAQYDENRGWFMPVTIAGFDKHQHNFDHIEFQYKESARGDDYWTNICSFYADSLLMQQASGVREMIPENGNIVTQFYGEGTVMEKAYDLRAVLFCRNGNTFLTTASPIVSGVKDTRRPQLYGTPKPSNGIIQIGDDIIFNFSEDIEHNYLSAITNFEVKGEVNNNNVSEAVSLQFSGQASVESEAQRNFSGKDLTIDLMIKPAETGRDMPLFSHGTNGKKLQLWLTSDFRLKAVIDDQEYVSTEAINRNTFTQVALSLDQENKTLTFYNGGKQIGSSALAEAYNGTGPLIFGRTNDNDRTQSSFYEGRMMEARLWYRAMDGGLIGTTYGSKRLTGYELGLVDYYPMNEGSGDYAIDHTQGANAQLKGASWAMPRGLSLHVDWEDRGLALDQNAITRTKEQDYTLMFWFKTDAEGRGVLISNGRGNREDVGAENQFNIAFEAEKLMYRSNGFAAEVPGDYSDNQWHHLAMTVSRSQNVANIYMDGTLRTTFDADTLGGISGGHPLIGAALYDELQSDGTVAIIDTRNWLRGNIDELCFFQQALPLTLIKSYSTRSPQGDEAGLLTYLPFDRQERQQDNDIVLVAYPYSRKMYLDDEGNIRYQLDPVTQEPTATPVRDYSFAESVSVETLLAHITDETAAPVVPYEELKNLKFGFVGKDNQVMVTLSEPSARLNRRNVYVTVRDIEDRNGNRLASPQTACYYVASSSLQWMTNRETATVSYGAGESLDLFIVNNGASSHTFSIDNCPKWLTLDNYADVIGPQDFLSIHGTVSKDLNVGSYDEILYLTDEDGVTEPLYLNLTVEGQQPDWAWSVDGDLLQYSMNIAGQVFLHDEIDIDTRDLVGVFDRENRCHGFAHINYSQQTGESGLYLTVYDKQPTGTQLYFKLWQYSTGRELMLTADGKTTLTFQNDVIMGTDTPVRFVGGDQYVQTFNLQEGWNWISFNVASERLFDLNALLDGLPWQENDILTDMNSNLVLTYMGGHWLASGEMKDVILTPRKAYAIRVSEPIEFPVAGFIIKQADERTITVKSGWNGIGYTPMLNLPLETALADYYDNAQPGDVIKSHDEFAYFTVSGGVGRWRGSLQYMKPGEGYMMLRKADSQVKFTYPFYEPGSTFIDEASYSSLARSSRNSSDSRNSRETSLSRKKATMSVSAIIEGFEPEEGDRLVAYTNGEQVGEAFLSADVLSAAAEPQPTEPQPTEPLYLSIAGDSQQPIWFAVERDGEIVAATDAVMDFKANAVIGSPDEPTVINFVHADRTDGKWYTVGGLLLTGKPSQQGVYIFNGKKVVIK